MVTLMIIQWNAKGAFCLKTQKHCQSMADLVGKLSSMELMAGILAHFLHYFYSMFKKECDL